jgi:hypothetical protein
MGADFGIRIVDFRQMNADGGKMDGDYGDFSCLSLFCLSTNTINSFLFDPFFEFRGEGGD